MWINEQIVHHQIHCLNAQDLLTKYKHRNIFIAGGSGGGFGKTSKHNDNYGANMQIQHNTNKLKNLGEDDIRSYDFEDRISGNFQYIRINYEYYKPCSVLHLNSEHTHVEKYFNTSQQYKNWNKLRQLHLRDNEYHYFVLYKTIVKSGYKNGILFHYGYGNGFTFYLYKNKLFYIFGKMGPEDVHRLNNLYAMYNYEGIEYTDYYDKPTTIVIELHKQSVQTNPILQVTVTSKIWINGILLLEKNHDLNNETFLNDTTDIQITGNASGGFGRTFKDINCNVQNDHYKIKDEHFEPTNGIRKIDLKENISGGFKYFYSINEPYYIPTHEQYR